jgi:hypothetical protein
VIAVPMGHNDGVQLREVDVFCFDVLGENVGVVSCIEQNAFAAIFDKSDIAQSCFSAEVWPKAS